MTRIRLIHWNADEAKVRIEGLRAAGYQVDYDALTSDLLRGVRERPPAAVVIDLARLPSHGREVALSLREYKGTRGVPLVFVEGEPEKVEKIRTLLPDAAFASWTQANNAIAAVIASPPKEPLVPSARSTGYSGTPLPTKLGIDKDAIVVLIDAPRDFAKTLGVLPAGADLRARATKERSLTIWFCKSARRYQAQMSPVLMALAGAPLWVAWPKKASDVESDMSETVVRDVAIAHGLVDYKVCAIDETWSALKFALREEKKPAPRAAQKKKTARR
jgi:CheY-like chemotaxis protein